ncbi:trimeric autotransporter adhesin [Pasteurella langaaensis DSM 22999]|uniref:Trimeric autotransporter adhesin n=1 Tax=Alitibacter langaaensis DSM 22999 TaxID=1122935 RepID=A0A2U0TH39_9PAST|nr:YadA-like family protein [Pasteurella langaaensis]PVX42890.1 trimeric autotransporter adhesin [Pasteurella langaaensis DSM 22999]
MSKVSKIKLSKGDLAFNLNQHGKQFASFSLTLAATLLATISTGYAADNVEGAGNGVALGTGSNALKPENVAIGRDAKIGYSNGASSATGDIAVGNGANINNYASQGGSIAIGKNAKIENMAGGLEASFGFGQTTYNRVGFFGTTQIPVDPTKVVASIAIGDNTFARTGSTIIGSHNYKGELGDTVVDTANTRASNLHIYTTNIGANSFINGAFATSTGVYNIMSSGYTGGFLSNPVKNFGATISGALNSIESSTGGYYSGIANAVTGVANRVANANGALVYGAGNEITNSIVSLSGAPTSSGDSAKALSESLREMVRNEENKGGGATMAFGGGNKADYTLRSALIGVNNELTGTSGSESTDNMLTGYKNAATNVKNTTIIGTENTAENSEDNVIMGSKRKITSVNHSIILGSGDSVTETTTNNVVIVGHNANADIANSVALGNDSQTVESGATTKGMDTYATDTFTIGGTTQALSFAGGKPVGVVSVGDSGKERRLQNVAAGYISATSTDAINGSQLYAILNYMNAGDGAASNKEETVSAGDNIEVTSSANATNSKDYKVSLKKDITVDNITAKQVKVGNTTVANNGVSIVNGPSMTSTGIDAANQKITNVANGEVSATSKDAVNGSQLHAVNQRVNNIDNRVSHIEGKLNSTRKEMRGIGANVAAGISLPQAYIPGKSMLGAAVGSYKNEAALAVGWSRASDNGKTIIKLTGTANTQGDLSTGVGIGYQY